MITESFSNARENLDAIMDRVVTEKVLIKIKRRGTEGVVLVSEREWSSIGDYALHDTSRSILAVAKI